MENKPFDIDSYFLENKQSEKIPENKVPVTEGNNVEQDIELVTLRIEETRTDITADYNNWIQIGFALAHELGEMGRIYFHRISRIYAKYSAIQTDKQYDSCMKTKTAGVTIKTFFYLAKQAQIDISQVKKNDDSENIPPDKETLDVKETEEINVSDEFLTPLLPDEIYENLPKILRDTCALFPKGVERDIYLLSALTVLSACLPNLTGVYFNRLLSTHLFLFITGPSASGKGTMLWSRILAQSIHDDLTDTSLKAYNAYLVALNEYENLPKNLKLTTDKPIEPPRQLLFIPANSSSAALLKILSDNNFRGIIFETEADTLTNTSKQDWGDSTDLYRKAFHHENTSVARKTNNEFLEIKDPHLALCLSGTPNQVCRLMPDVENGLFSRFMYYAFKSTGVFLNPFVSYQPIDYNLFFTQKGYEVFHFHNRLLSLTQPIDFQLTEAQGMLFTNFFQELLNKNKTLLCSDLDANIKRLGVITFRIAMVISALRLMDAPIGEKYPTTLVCENSDYETAIAIAATLESHAVAVYQKMPKVKIKGNRLLFYEKLPKSFNRKKYLEIAKEINMSIKQADKYIALFCIELLDHEKMLYNKKI